MPRPFLAPDQKIQNYSNRGFIKDVYKAIQPYFGRFIFATVFRITSDIVNLYSTYAIAKIITILSSGDFQNQIESIWFILEIWAATQIYRLIGIYIAKTLIFNISDKVLIDVSQNAINHIIKLDIKWHEQENTGNKLERIRTASLGFHRILHIWINNFIEIGINFIGAIAIIYQFNKTIAIIMALFLMTYSIISKLLVKRTAAAFHAANVQMEAISGLQYETVNNIRTVKIMSMVEQISKTLRSYFSTLLEKTKNKVFWVNNRIAGENGVAFIFKLGILVYILQDVIAGTAEIGLLILVSNYFNTVWGSVNEFSNISQDYLVARYSISRLKTITNEPILIDNEFDKLPFPREWKSIELKDVSFGYGANEVLNNINISIKRGEKIGIVGLSGAGKSTLFKLLLKEYESFSGNIQIDNIPIQSISKQDYFKHVAVVLQDTEVFNFSLRENIYLASPGTINKDVELQHALTIAHVNDFISKLPNGIDTAIGEKGVRLSGGEKQRLGIARAVFKQPQLLLLDEATSHLDLESEEKIQDSLHQFFKDVTAVVIAHRLTTIKEMDRILVIEDGTIIEDGSFAELQAKQGRFFELWEKQRL